jgi:hypothetical protein
MTRRRALAAGAALGGGVLLGGTAAVAAGSRPLRLVERLRDDVKGATLDKQLQSRLLNVLSSVKGDLKQGRDLAASNRLQHKFVPLVKQNRERHGLTAKQSSQWVDDSEEIIALLYPGIGSSAAFGNVFIFNLYPDAAQVTDLNGQGAVGAIPSPDPEGWTPQHIMAPRTNVSLEQLDTPAFVSAGESNQANSLTLNYGGQAWRAEVVIPNPPDPPLEVDLWIYLTYELFMLAGSATGQVIPQPGGALGRIQPV